MLLLVQLLVFNNLCMERIGEFLYLSVFALNTLYFSLPRVSMECSFFLSGKYFLSFPSAKLCFANLSVKICRLNFKVFRFKTVKASKYDLYLSPRTSLQKVFCVLSRSASFSAVRLLLQTAQDCSNMLRQNVLQSPTISSLLEPKLHTFLKSSILAFTFFIILLQFSSQDSVLVKTVPRILIWSTTSIF